MALSYYLNKLLKDCVLNHHGRTGPESAARARGAICRTVQSVQMIQFAFGNATFIIRNVYKSVVVYKEKFQCHIILQKSFEYADLLLKKNISLSMLKTVLLLFFVETMIPLKHLYNCAFTPQAARASKWPEVIHFQCEPAASSGESGVASFGRWERRGELKSSQLYGNELWCGSAATNRNVEVLRLRGFQRTQSCKFWFRPH